MHRVLTTNALVVWVFLVTFSVPFPAIASDDVDEGVQAYEAGEYARAYEFLKPAADAGIADAQYFLGRMYDHAYGVSRNRELALELFFSAANQGHAVAQRVIAYSYSKGIGVQQNYKKAAYWYRKSAEAGDGHAQHSMGLRYLSGEGVTKDYVKAVEWFRRGAEQKNSGSMYELGRAYHNGEGVTQDAAEAVHWIRKAAVAGSIHAKRMLSWFYENGRGVEQDLEEAARLRSKVIAADGNYLDHFRMGVILNEHSRQTGSMEHRRRAIPHLEEAARGGHILSMIKVGLGYKRGQAVERDYAEAYAWLKLAEAHGARGGESSIRTTRARMGYNRDLRIRAQERAEELAKKIPSPY